MQRNVILQGASLLALASAASAQIVVSADIATSTTWTSNNVYKIEGDVFVLPGATLTIQPGTVIASTNVLPGPVTTPAALVVCRGAQIIADGTANAPIIFTSTQDRATWTGGNPQTGTYRQTSNNEWGGLLICGSAYISENQVGTNTPAPSASNYADMEGLTPAITSLNDYGGGNDDDDSGSISYCSFRYGGFSIAPGIEVNGLSLGGLGRNTEMHHIEVLNSLDDGIECWGGTVNFKFFSIWNSGDDTLDIDQGWRGRAQFGLLVQGLSGAGAQGSGFSDNGIEVDGAELCNYQPVTTATLYNLTMIGLPPFDAAGNSDPTYAGAGDHLTAWRDNANVQIRNSVLMDCGDNVINNDVTDGENGNTGYGCGGTLTWATRWTTPASTTSPVNPFANPAAAYTAQIDGNLIEFRDNVFFNNIRPNTYAEANLRSVFTNLGGGTNNANNVQATLSPISFLARGPVVTANGTNRCRPITFLDPTPSADALTSVEIPSAANSFFTRARYRGAFPAGNNWLIGWTAAATFGLTSNSKANVYIEAERSGLAGVPVHYTSGTWAAGTPVTLSCYNVGDLGGGLNIGAQVFGFFPINFPILGGLLVPNPDVVNVVTGAGGTLSLAPFVVPSGLSGLTLYSQWATFDVGVPSGEFAFSNAQAHTLP